MTYKTKLTDSKRAAWSTPTVRRLPAKNALMSGNCRSGEGNSGKGPLVCS